jgi:nucleoid-associated protein YgaU
MPNDAKLGLIVGVGVVVAVAVVFFRKEPAMGVRTPGDPAAASVGAAAPPAPQAPDRQVRARTSSREIKQDNSGSIREHTVAEGETLFSLAVRYYGDKSKFADIYLANRSKVHEPDQLTPGTVLVIPGVEAPPPDNARAEGE